MMSAAGYNNFTVPCLRVPPCSTVVNNLSGPQHAFIPLMQYRLPSCHRSLPSTARSSCWQCSSCDVHTVRCMVSTFTACQVPPEFMFHVHSRGELPAQECADVMHGLANKMLLTGSAHICLILDNGDACGCDIQAPFVSKCISAPNPPQQAVQACQVLDSALRHGCRHDTWHGLMAS